MALIQEVHLKMASFRPAPVIPAVQNDTNRSARMIIDDFTLQEGMTGKLSFKRSDGTYYEIDAELELQTNSFQADLAQALTQPGRTMAQLKVYDGEDVVSTYTFTIFVEEDATGQPTFQETINMRKAVEEAEEAADIAEAAADRAEAAALTLKTDTTLKQSGQAADAKVVGDEIGFLDNAISGIEGLADSIVNLDALEWELGTIDINSGAEVASATRIRTNKYYTIPNCVSITASADAGYKFRVIFYDSNNTPVVTVPNANSQFLSGSATWKLWGNAVKVKLVASDSSDGTASVSYGEHIHLSYESVAVNAVSDIFTALTSSIINIGDKLGWEQGGLDTSTAEEFDSNKRIRSGFIDATKLSELSIALDSTDYRIAIYKYDSAKAFIGYSAWYYYKVTISEPSGYYRLVYSYASDAPMTPSASSTITITGALLEQEELQINTSFATNVKNLSNSESDIFSLDRWEQGAIKTEDGTNFAATNRLRTVGYLDISEFDTIKITVDSGYKYAIYFYDSTYTYLPNLYFPGVWNTIDHVYSISDTTAKYLRLIISDMANNTSAYDMFKHFHFYAIDRFRKSTSKYRALEDSSICVMSYNAQFFTDRNSDHAMIKAIIDKYMPDVLGITEYINFADNINIHRTLFSEYSYSQLQLDITAGNAIYTKREQTDGTNVQFTSNNPDGEIRGYNKTYINVNGVSVALYNTHLEILPSLSASRPYRTAQAAELLADANAEEYVIIMGDFNTGDCLNTSGADYDAVIKPFIDAGYHSANCSTQHGFLKTYYNGSTVEGSTTRWCLDQIITSPNIDILNVNIDKTKLSQVSEDPIDHLPVIAYLHIN